MAEPTAPAAEPHDACPSCHGGRDIVEMAAADGVDVVAEQTPRLDSPYECAGFRCPACHRVWWMHPTDAQIAAWTRDGVP